MEDMLNALVLMANFIFVPALAYGSQLALGAVGVTLIFGILRFANFAHGDMMAFGTMITIFVTWALQGAGITAGPLPTALLALPVGIAATIILVLLTDRFIFSFYRKKRSPPVIYIVASVGVMFMLNGIVRLFIGPDDRKFTDGARFIISARDFKQSTGLAEGLSIQTTQALTVLVAVAAVAALFWFLQKTRTGKSMRAFSDNEDLALLCGINPDKVVRVTWVLAAVLAVLAGVLYGLDKSFKPFIYFNLLLPFFAAAILGGIGQPVGAIVGGYIVAFTEVTATYAYKQLAVYTLPASWLPEGLLQFLSTDYKFAISFIILVLVLLIRPTGIFRGRVF